MALSSLISHCFIQVIDKLWLWPSSCSFENVSLFKKPFSIVQTSVKRLEVNEEEEENVKETFSKPKLYVQMNVFSMPLPS